VASLRFGLRGHGKSEGRQEELTPATVLNDIRVALAHLREAVGAQEISLLGASFTGGICAYYAAKQRDEIARLVLFNNEVFWLRPHEAPGEVQAPTLIVHGTKDTFVPVEASRAAVRQFGGPYRLVEIEGAQHGFAVHEDPQYLNPQSQECQAFVIRTTPEWLNQEA
jgi:pimeloyl-ACP methyl ester carboxylesterase